MTGSQVAGEVRTLFDTSVLVPALVDQLENHEAALRALKDYTTGGNSAYCSAHALAETMQPYRLFQLIQLSPPSTRTRKKSCAIIAALREICGL